nr:PREDICTED: oxygen-regulated protein 1-like [Pundamilia nyererei]
MSTTPIQEPPTQGLSSGSGQTLPSRPLQLSSDPSASKRVCFYKSGDYQFGGHRMVINTRTFKTFDALLDVLSKKVPLAFGVRTITTPRGTHLVKALDDLHDGGAYVCSDQKRVKPINLDEVNRRQVPWNTTRPLSAGRRRRPAKVTERVAVRTPKRLMVIKNRDPSVKRTIVLQRRTAPTFDALLDYLSQILQFPVLKLYSTDGRRVDGLAALILCSGVVVAAGNEPFRLANYSFHRTGQMAQAMFLETAEPSMLQPRAQKKKSFSSGRGSRNFSVSSERYIVNQINESQNGHLHPHNGVLEAEANQHHTSMEMSGTGREDNVNQTCVVPHDDDIEKSFRVNQDGSMTVEMKVRLTIKEEEMLHWTTTLSRTSLSKRAACASISESGNRSPDSNNVIPKDSSSISEEETKEENFPSAAGKGVGFNDERTCEGYTSTATRKAKKSVKRTPTPGPRHVNKKASIESVKRVTESGVQESMLGHYSYVERTADGETTEGYCLVKHSSSSSNRPIPKPRKTASAGMSNKCTPSSIRSSGVAEVLQIQNNGMEFRETVMHIYETQGCYDNYLANQEYSVDGVPLHGSPPAPQSKQSTDSGPHSSSNDCDIDCSWQPPTADSLQRQKEEMLSLSSEPVSLTHENTNNLSSPSENETKRNLQILERVKLDNTPKSTTKKKMTTSARSQKSSTSTSNTDKKPKESLISPSKDSKHSSADKLSSKVSVGKRSVNSSESARSGQKSKGAEKKAESLQSKKSNKGEKTPTKSSASLVRTAPQRQNTSKEAASDIGHNVNTPTGRPQMKKNMSDILQPNKSLTKKTTSKPKSMPESGISPTKPLVSMPSLDPSPSEIHQYVENWLEKVTPDQVPYPEEVITEETQPRTKVIFQIGGDSESDEKNECHTNFDENNPSSNDVIKGSSSCLSVPLSHQELTTVQGLSVSMPNVRADLEHQENRLRPHKSAEAICPAGDETSSSSNFLSPKAKIKPALQQLCSSIQCIRRASDTNVASNLEKSNSLPDFPTQVASVFGSSCKAFVSFLSVMTLRDHLIDSTPREDKISRTKSEAMLMMESLQKISAIEDEEEQRASLTDLQSRASSRLRQSWKDFQILRERLESEPLSPKVSETEFALDVVSEGGDAFEEQHSGIDELMEELSMPQDLREQIASTIRTFYPVEESQCVETDRNQSDSEEDLEQFVQDCNDETKQSLESDSRCEDWEREEEEEEEQEVKSGEVSSEESIDKEEGGAYEEEETKEEESRKEEQLEEKREVKIKGDGDTEDESEGTEKEDGEREEDREEEPEQSESDEDSGEGSVDKEEAGVDEEEQETDEEETTEEVDEVNQQYRDRTDTEADSEGTEKENRGRGEDGEEKPEQSESEEVSDEQSLDKKGAGADEEEEEMTLDERELGDELGEGEEEEADETDEDFMNEDPTQYSAEETDEREGAGETEEEEKINEKVYEEGEEKSSDGGENEERHKEEKEDEGDNVEDTNKGGGVENVTVELEQEEEENEELHLVTGDVEQELLEGTEVSDDEEKKIGDGIEADEEKEVEAEINAVTATDAEESVSENADDDKEMEEFNEDRNELEVEDEKETQQIEEVSEGNNEEEEEEVEEEREQDEEHEDEGSGDSVVKNTEEERARTTTDEEEVDGGRDMDTEDEKYDEAEDRRREPEQTESSQEVESAEERECGEELERDENLTAGQTGDEEEREDDEEKEPQEKLDQEKKQGTESPSKYSSEGQCADDKGNGTDTVTETDEGGEMLTERSGSLSHPGEISQELLDFVNYALRSSSLVFIYDKDGNIRIEPDNAQVVKTKQSVLLKSRKDSSYGLKCLPSPSTSDLSDYRPETSESGSYRTQESVDIMSESGGEASEKPSPVYTHSAVQAERTSLELASSKLSVASNSGTFPSSSDSGTKASREDLSYFSAASSLKADREATTQAAQCIAFVSQNSADGVLIDQGRWLLKENHLIRKSPPVSLGMYSNLDSTSVDTGQENTSDDSPPHFKTQHSPLAAISSSELEEMAKPPTPKCIYYNLPHGSDSDPFLDASSIKSSDRGRGVRVSPTIDTSKTWANKNGSQSSFASVEFRIPDRKVHPEGESAVVTQPSRTSGGVSHVLQAQDSMDNLHLRCGQYCPIL